MKVIPVIPERIEEFHSLKSSSLFTSMGWVQCFGPSLQRFFLLDENEKPIGGFVAYHGGKGNLRTLITPPFTPHIGLFTIENKNKPVKINSFRKEVIDAIADFLLASRYVYFKLDFAPEWHDMQPMIWKKIHATIRYTYQIDLNQSESEINDNLDSSKRNKINKGGRDGLVVSHDPDEDTAYRLISENLESNAIKVHNGILKNIFSLVKEKEHGIFTMTSSENKIVAVNVCVIDNNTCFNLLSAIDRKNKQGQSGTFSLYHSILKAKEKGLLIFDFEGSGVPEIEEFFRSFGGNLTPYFSVSGGKWPWPLLLKLRRRIG